MDDLIKQLATYLRGMWKYRHLGVAVTWAVAAVAAVFVLLTPDRYEASARVYVDTQSILRPLMSGLAVQPNVEQQVSMLSRTLISRPTVEKLVRMADLDLGAKTKNEQDKLIQEVTAAIRIRTTGKDNIYTLGFVDANKDKSLKVVQSLLTLFVESSLGSTRNDSDAAKRFLEEQIKTYETRLTEAETRLKDFKLRNLELQAKGEVDMAGRMGEITSTLSQARLELREAESAREAARKQLEQIKSGKGPAGPIVPVITTPEIDGRIDAQKRNLDSLLQRYTEAHPDVANARRLIKELEAQKVKEVAELRKAAQNAPVTQAQQETNPAVLELSRLLSAAEVQVASLRARVGEYEGRLAKAREQVKLAPQIEAELAQLNRDYDVHKKNYDSLVSRRESAQLSGELENASGVADFRVIDPPRVDNRPVAPNRVMLMPAALVAAIAAGLGITFLLSQVRPVFFEGGTVRNVTELPLLGVVSLVRNDALKAKERRTFKRFLASIVALVGVFVVGIAILAYRSGFFG